MSNRPYSDQFEMTEKIVEHHMRPLLCAMFSEIEELKRGQKRLEELQRKQMLSIHDVIHYTLIGVLGVLFLIGLTGC